MQKYPNEWWWSKDSLHFYSPGKWNAGDCYDLAKAIRNREQWLKVIAARIVEDGTVEWELDSGSGHFFVRMSDQSFPMIEQLVIAINLNKTLNHDQ